MKPTFIDTHCHVHFEAYRQDMDEVVARALDSGVGMITIGTQSTTSRNAVALAERYEYIWATIGLHPNHLHKQEFHDHNELPEQATVKTRGEQFDPALYEDLASHPKVVAIGEFGLDYYRIPIELDADQVKIEQQETARQQIAFANRFNKPIVIHCRDAHEDQYALLKESTDQGGLIRRGVIHSFTGTAEDAERYHSIGFFVAVNGILTFSKELQDAVKNIPLEQILVETDSPYLTPPPNRGKRNEPVNVKDVAAFLAEIKGVSIDEVASTTTQNANKLFGLSL